eukprot:437897-Pleurochrysis_carterae.AAC.1
MRQASALALLRCVQAAHAAVGCAVAAPAEKRRCSSRCQQLARRHVAERLFDASCTRIVRSGTGC